MHTCPDIKDLNIDHIDVFWWGWKIHDISKAPEYFWQYIVLLCQQREMKPKDDSLYSGTLIKA